MCWQTFLPCQPRLFAMACSVTLHPDSLNRAAGGDAIDNTRPGVWIRPKWHTRPPKNPKMLMAH